MIKQSRILSSGFITRYNPNKYIFSTFMLIVLMLLIVSPASAHGFIVRAVPENRAVLPHSPARLQYWFSEALEPSFSTLNVRDQNGGIIATGGVDPLNNTLMSVRLPTDIPDGAYVIELRPAFASDGHAVAQSYVLFIGEEIGGIGGKAADEIAQPLEIVWRTITLASIMLLFGTFTLYTIVLVPAWGNKQYRAGWLPPRLMKRLNWIVALALMGAFAGNILALIQQTMVFFNFGFTKALDSNYWSLVRIGSRFGDIWNTRMVFLMVVAVLFGLSLYFRDEYPETVRAFWSANAWMTALILGTFSVLSHAAGSLLLPWLGITVDWMHMLGVGFWAGGVAALVLVLPAALQPYSEEARRLALLAALRRFSRIAAGAVIVVIATGIYSASNWFYTPSDVATPFGTALGVKIVLVMLLVGIGALHQITLHPTRYTQLTKYFNAAVPFGSFMKSLRLEALLVLIVLLAVGWLSATPVPVPEFTETNVQAPSAAQTIDDLTVVMNISPGGPGVNTYDTTITRNGERIDDVEVYINTVNAPRDERSGWQVAEPADPGLFIAADDAIDAPGRWWTLIDLVQGENQQRLAFEWEISNDSAVIESVNPGFFNAAALILVSLSLAWAVYPLALRLYRMLDLQPVMVAVAVGTIVIAIGALILGWIVIQNTRAGYAETINPPPQVVNAVLPTQASLERGQALFETDCAAWQADRDYRELINRLPRTRDEELYFAVLEGWRNLPACGADLSLYQRWDIVNYIRSQERL